MAKTEFIYEKYVLELIEKVTNEYKFPQKKHYDIEVAILRTKKECENGGKYTAEQVHSNVSRTLDRLSKGTSSKLIRYKRYFLPNTNEYLFYKLSEEFYSYLKELIKVEEKVCLISHNMCAIWAKPSTEKEVNDCIAECLGENIYAVFGEDDFCYVILKHPETQKGSVPNENSKEFIVLKAFEDAISRIYDKQQKTLKKIRTV